MACKIFEAHSLTKVVQWIFLGSANPYVWNESAIRCALLRRQILAELVPYWLGPRVGVANAFGFDWNEDHRAFELHTELSPGRAVDLHHPLRTNGGNQLGELLHEVMAPLQEHLIEAGFDGLVWQAGKGNPVALNNWLYEPRSAGGGTWRWIDLESGVPALAPLNPWALFSFYLPRSVAYGRPLFDDVSPRRLRDYLERHAAGLRSQIGKQGLERLIELSSRLETRQRDWKSLRRIDRSLGYRLSQGEIDQKEAARYRDRPLQWYARESRRAAASALRGTHRLLRRFVDWLGSIDLGQLGVAVGRFLTSQRYRAGVARHYLAGRIDAWRSRGQLGAGDAEVLRSHLDCEESGSYLTDFGVHVAVKPLVKSIEYWVFPALFALGLINEVTLALAVLSGGAIARSAYTVGRIVQSAVRGREKPWFALIVGVVPVFGNFAYPLQVLYSSTEQDEHLARFILYDGCARIGAHLPIWGGRDTLTEHCLNRLPERLPHFRR